MVWLQRHSAITMMEPLDSPDRDNGSPPPPLLPLSIPPRTNNASVAPAKSTAAAERDMLFFRRPDLNARQLFFQHHNSSMRHRADSSSAVDSAVPVQLIGVDGRTHIGMPASATAARRFNEVTVTSQDASRGLHDRRRSRLVVTSDRLRDPLTKRRLHHIKLVFAGAAFASILLTTSLLFPSDSDAWFYVDGFKSTVGPAHSQRLKTNRLALLILTITGNIVGSAATAMQSEGLLTVFIFGTVLSDLWTLTMLLPHPFYFLRLLFDVLLLLLAVEARTYLTQPWFVTNFHRLRY